MSLKFHVLLYPLFCRVSEKSPLPFSVITGFAVNASGLKRLPPFSAEISCKLPKRKRPTRAKFRSIMWRATTKPSSARRFLRWYSRNWNGETSVADGAVSTYSPAKSVVDNAEAGTAPRPGTPRISTKRPSGSVITNLTATANAPHRTLRMRTSTVTSFRQSTSFLPRKTASSNP